MNTLKCSNCGLEMAGSNTPNCLRCGGQNTIKPIADPKEKIFGPTTPEEKERRNKNTTTEGGITTFRSIDDLVSKMEALDRGHITGQFYIDIVGDNTPQTTHELSKISFGWISSYIKQRKITFSIHKAPKLCTDCGEPMDPKYDPTGTATVHNTCAPR